MRKHLLLLCFLLSQMAMAGIVSQSEAQQKALDFMARRNAAAAQKGMRLAAKGSQLTPAASEALYYVFNAGQADGFVVVSGDDRTPAILGYATNGTFSEADMPDNMRAWMAEYDRQLRFLANHPNAGIAKVQLDEHAAIAPLLKTTWNQGAPYNDKCPIDPSTSTRCVTGCVATAMAQVINYHKYPASTTATIPAYTSNASISLDAIAPTTIDWANMLDNYTGSETTEQKNAVATLMQLCGASVKMDYTAHSSGAQSQMVASALKTYFDFDATVYCASRDLYRANAWNNLIYNEIANNRPVCYGGQSMGGGHEFVIDGYDREGLFHVNWGWGGSSDNYFLLSILDPNNNSGTGASTSTDGYSFGQDATINAMPNKGNVVEDPVRLSINSISTTTTSFDYDSNNEGYVVQFSASVWNQSGDTGTFDLAMAAYDAQGNMQSGSYIVEEVELGNGWGWKNMNCVGLLNLPDGEYTIFLISKLNSDNNWRPNLGSEKYHLKATVNNNVLTLSGGTVNLSATSITATGSLEIGGMVNVSATITNNSDALFNDVLYLQVDGEDISAKYFEADSGQSDVFDIVYKPTSSGTKTLSIGYKTGDSFVSIGSKDITISAAHSYSLTFSNGTITNAISSIINADKAQIQVSVKNTGSYAYNDCIKTYAFKNTSGGSSWSYFGAIETPVSIGVGATKTVDIEYNHLTDGRYWFIMVYKTNGEYISHNDTGARYSALYDYTVVVPAPVQPSLEGTYYLQHVESGKFMSAGHEWSTRGIVDSVGLDFTLQAVGENTYTIDSRVSNGGMSNYLGTNLYVDAPVANWVITALSADTYSIGNGTEYLDVDADNELVLTSEPVAWRFMTRSDRLAALEAATVSQGMDATFLLPGANFSRNDSRVGESWVVSGDCTNSDLQNGTNENYCAESYHSTFTISQTIADAPAGRYLLSAQGFYRQDGPTADAPYFFINNEKANVPVKTGSENNMTDAANSFTEGLYTVSGIECELGNDEALTVGVRGTSTTQWVIFDNFRLTYLGPTSQLLNHLTVSASKTSLREGETFHLTITSEEARGEDWNIQLTCNSDGQFSFNNVVVMPAGIGSTIYQIIYDVYEYTNICKDSGGGSSARRKAQASHSWVQQFDNVALKFVDQLKTADSLINYAYGDHIWFDELDEGKARFMEWIDGLPEDYQPTDEELLEHKPESASLTQMRAYVNHINGLGDNLPSVDKLEGLLTTYKQLNDEAKEAGYMSLTDQFSASYDNYVDRYMNMKRSSVCATISLQLSQEMVLTRQAFRGTLTVFNGHESDAMTDVRLHLEVKNIETGELATSHEMQMNAETLTGFSGEVSLDGIWELGAQATGKATVLFIPTKFAAATTPQRYSFGGTLTYIDPFTELQVTRKLYPVMLTVNPTADIELDYFMQRDIFGDDPLTEGVVEPMHPAEFALIINNKGYGDAKNVRMLTHQPEIIDNEKGLLINFAIVGSQTNGQPASMTLSKDFANDFGTIPSQSQAYAQWWLHSTLLGHFTDYDVQVNHLTSYGNPDLSLVDTARIHELIHGFTVSSQSEPTLRGFLVNELPDAYDQPDSLFFTNATQSSVRMADNASVERLNDTEYMLVITPSVEGWNYGSLSDPTNGRQLLTSIVRQSDGKELSVDNMWQTDRTLRDGEDWLYEKRLHFIVEMGSQQESYRLVFTEDPDAGVLVLNENDMIHPTESHQGDVRLVRSLKRDKWNTLCLPFSMTDEEVRDVWGDNAYVASFNKTEVDNNGDAVLGFLIHNNGIQANVPCLIKPSVDTLNILLHNREVVWEDNPSVTIDDMAFKGNYEAGTQVPVGDYYISEAQFYRSQGYSTMQAYRGWFHDTSVMSGSRRLKMAFDDGNKPTVILWSEDSKKPVVTPRYDIRGIEHTDRPRGIYIEEGRKRVKSATSSN